MTNMIDLFNFTSWELVSKQIKHHYPDDYNNYSGLFEYFKNLSPVKTKDFSIDLSIASPFADIIRGVEEKHIKNLYDTPDTCWYSMGMEHETEKQGYGFLGTPWVELASMPIAESTLLNNLPEEIVAHFLWEVTFYGTEEDASNFLENLKEQVNSIQDINDGN